MASRYAQDTKVPVARSRAEIEETLQRYGCDAFAFGWSPQGAMVQFGYKGRAIKLDVPVPNGDGVKEQRLARQRWRILLLLIKANIEAVEIGLVTFEQAFLSWMLLADGSTVAQKMIPQLPEPKETPRLRAVHR